MKHIASALLRLTTPSADVMMGWKYRKSQQGVDSDLAAHVAQELKNEAMIAKEAGKACEEAGGPPPKSPWQEQGQGLWRV